MTPTKIPLMSTDQWMAGKQTLFNDYWETWELYESLLTVIIEQQW